MALTPQQVAEKKFTSTRFKNGYDETEVDAFLDEVEAELTRLGEESAGLRRQLESAQLTQAVRTDESAETPTPARDATPSQGEMEEMLRRTLLLAQRTADEVVAEAKADAERELAEARARAEALRTDSEQRAAETERAASTRATVSIAEAETRKRRLEEQITALHGFENDFRGRLRAYLELQLKDLDGTTLVPPGGAPVPPPSAATPSSVASAPAAPDVVAAPPSAVEAAPPAAVEAAPPAAVEAAPQPPPRAEPPPVVLPDLPPLPSWMSADAGFVTDDEPATQQPPAPEES